MTEFIALTASPRDIKGKASRKLRPMGQIPAVLYGYGVEPTTLALGRHEFELLMARETLGATILEVSVEGGDSAVPAIVKEIQKHPVSGRVQHVDLLAIDMKHTIHTSVPIRFVGDSVGVKEGGILTQTLTEVEIEVLPTNLPDHIDAHIADLNVGDALHVSELVVPDDVTVLSDPESIVCSITVAKVVEEVVPELEEELEELEALEEAAEGEEVAEGEAAPEAEEEE